MKTNKRREARAMDALIAAAFLGVDPATGKQLLPPLRLADIHEHDMIRVRANVKVEGHSLRAGMIGTVVSVYRNGEAFAVELERGRVVTLRRNQIVKKRRR